MEAQPSRRIIVSLGLAVALALALGQGLAPCFAAEVPVPTWKHLSSQTGDPSTSRGDASVAHAGEACLAPTQALPAPKGGKQQTACLVLDLDKDERNDIVIAERSQAPALVWLRHAVGFPNAKQGVWEPVPGWQEVVIEVGAVPIAAGGTFCDIDGDGDLDLVFGSSAAGSEIWWWENPFPNYDGATSWNRRVIARTGKGMHHDQLAGDFLGLGRPQIVSWFQGGSALLLFPLPTDPRQDSPWPAVTVAGNIRGGEGLAAADVDGDGKLDIVGAGRWFKHLGSSKFATYLIDVAQTGGRVALGDLKEGGLPEAVMVLGDGVGRLKWYECIGDPRETAAWKGHDLLDAPVNHGHSLQIADLNSDGNLDIFCGEMAQWGASVNNPQAKAWVFYGDGQGGFTKTLLAAGFDFHEAKVADVNGDGRLDIVDKPFVWQTPRVDIWRNELGSNSNARPTQ